MSNEENGFLIAPFMEEDIKKAIFQMEHNKAPGPDGFPTEFYQNFWDIIKVDLSEMFNAFLAGQIEFFKLNFGKIILLPKVKNANRIQQYRPICLLNVSFKILTKVATLRLNSVASHIIRPTQTTFMQGCYILDGVVTLHETVHELHWKTMDGAILQFDFEKPYDKVKWPFLHQVFRMKGFSETWCTWVYNFVTTGSVAVKVNDAIGHYSRKKIGKVIRCPRYCLISWLICWTS